MSKSSQAVINWRKRTKKKIVDSMGGCCQICGYDKCIDALELHHINPEEKEFSFGKVRASPKKLEMIKAEIQKCILLCSNCHREIHANLVKLPLKYAKFDETILIGENELRKRFKQQTAISVPPSLRHDEKKVKEHVNKRKIFLTVEQLNDMLYSQFNGNKSALARYLNVSETAVRKKLNNAELVY